MKGDILAHERVELGATARVTGNVYYALIEMEMGAEINGKLIHEPRRSGVGPSPQGARRCRRLNRSTAEHVSPACWSLHLILGRSVPNAGPMTTESATSPVPRPADAWFSPMPLPPRSAS